MLTRTAFIGFGEAASAFATDARWTAEAVGFDLKLDDARLRQSKTEDFVSADVAACATCAEALLGQDKILSLVTANQSIEAALTASRTLERDALFFDMNSVSPGKKTAAAEIIHSGGGRYIDVAIMSPVYPAQLDVPLLVSGPHAIAGEAALREMGFSTLRQVGTEIGKASVIKMVRSVMVKGIEALTAECVLAANAAGVTEDVLNSLGTEWLNRANYNFERMLVHGERRAAEMEEVCATLEDLGIEWALTRGTVGRQRELGALGHQSPPETLEDKLALITRSGKVHAA